MDRLSDRAIEIINGLHTERLDYDSEYIPLIDAVNCLKDYEDTGLTPEEIKQHLDEAAHGNVLGGKPAAWLMDIDRAEKDGRLVVLPFPVHSVLVNMSDLENPELLKDFRISASWTHCGIVFHSPWAIFQKLVENGSIKRVSPDTEAVLKGDKEK